MQRSISRNKTQLMIDPSDVTPRKKARKANGSAKMVWANFSRERYDRIGINKNACKENHLYRHFMHV